MAAHHGFGPTCDLCNLKLLEAHPYMANWFVDKKKKYVNLHVSWSYRDEVDQNRLMAEGKSKLHYPMSKHNYKIGERPCSLALDVFQIDEDGVARFSFPFYKLLDAENTADKLPIFWGGSWNLLSDYNHYEIHDTKLT